MENRVLLCCYRKLGFPFLSLDPEPHSVISRSSFCCVAGVGDSVVTKADDGPVFRGADIPVEKLDRSK